MTQGRTACRWHIRAGENEIKEIPAFFRRHSVHRWSCAYPDAAPDWIQKTNYPIFYTMTCRISIRSFLMKGMKEGVTRLLSAIDRREEDRSLRRL